MQPRQKTAETSRLKPKPTPTIEAPPSNTVETSHSPQQVEEMRKLLTKANGRDPTQQELNLALIQDDML